MGFFKDSRDTYGVLLRTPEELNDFTGELFKKTNS